LHPPQSTPAPVSLAEARTEVIDAEAVQADSHIAQETSTGTDELTEKEQSNRTEPATEIAPSATEMTEAVETVEESTGAEGRDSLNPTEHPATNEESSSASSAPAASSSTDGSAPAGDSSGGDNDGGSK
jgi:hypothetical protein